MYQIVIKNDDEVIEIHSPVVNKTKCTSAKIKKGINTFDALNLSFLPDNPAYGHIRPLKTLVSVYNTKTDETIYRGRFLTPEDSMDSSGKFEFSYVCADEKSYLQDSIQPYKKMQNTTPAQAFSYLIGIHNALVEPEKQFVVGKVEVTNNTDNVYRYIDAGATTWDAIMEKLVKRLGGELQVRYADGIRYIDWLNEIGKVSTTKIELAKNLRSISRTVDPTEVVTRLFSYGARIEGEEGNTDAAQPRVTIASVNAGKEYIDAKKDLLDEFGISGKSKIWDDIHDPKILLSTAKKYVENQKTLLSKYVLEAVDLSLIGLDIENFEVGNYNYTINPVMSIDEYLRVIGMTLDLIDVETSTLSIGDKFLTQSEYQLAAYKNGENINDLGNKIQGLQIINSSQQEKLNDLSDTVNDIDLGPIQTEINKKPDRTELEKYQPLVTDTGWVRSGITLLNGANVYGTDSKRTPGYRIVKIGNLEIVTIWAELKNVPTANWTPVLRFPDVARPETDEAVTMPGSGNMQCRWRYYPNGEITIEGRTGETPNLNSWYPIKFQFYRGGI